MPQDWEEQALLGKWRHSHEDDTPTMRVFRPASEQFGPSRGRVSLEFQPGGSLIYEAPGPTDRTERSTGTWERDAQGRLIVRVPGRLEQVFDTSMLHAGRLLQKQP